MPNMQRMATNVRSRKLQNQGIKVQNHANEVWNGLTGTERRIVTVLQQTGPLDKLILTVVHLPEFRVDEIDNALDTLIQKNVVNIASLCGRCGRNGCYTNELHLDPDFQRPFSISP